MFPNRRKCASYLTFVKGVLLNLLYSGFKIHSSVSFAVSALYLISLANVPLSDELCLSTTTNHLILFSTLSHTLTVDPSRFKGNEGNHGRSTLTLRFITMLHSVYSSVVFEGLRMG